MKARTSFVSNSSSASFICMWQCSNTIDDGFLNKTEAIRRFTEEPYNCVFEKGSLGDVLNRNTVELDSPGFFRTEMIISMLNDITSCPIEMTQLVAGLAGGIVDGFKLIDFRIEGD